MLKKKGHAREDIMLVDAACRFLVMFLSKTEVFSRNVPSGHQYMGLLRYLEKGIVTGIMKMER